LQHLFKGFVRQVVVFLYILKGFLNALLINGDPFLFCPENLQFLINQLINEVVNSKISIPKGDLVEYFENHPEVFNKAEQVRVRHIMVETEEEARSIIKKLKNKRNSFPDLARDYSRGLEGDKGGDLGYLEAGQMPQEFDEIFKLKLNQITGIIQTPYGFHVFKLSDKIPERKMSFQESSDIIKSKLVREAQEVAFKDWLNQIKQEAKIEVDYKVLKSIG